MPDYSLPLRRWKREDPNGYREAMKGFSEYELAFFRGSEGWKRTPPDDIQ
jgi:hypothetical protein